MIRYKIDVFEVMRKYGYTQNRLRREKILSAQTMQNIKEGKSITLETLNMICVICRCQPGDIIEVVPTDEEKIRFF